MENFTNNLKLLRKQRNLTQQQLANILNITQQAYANYEMGIREPNMETLLLIAKYFGVSLDYLYGRDYSDEYKYDINIKKCG